MPKGVYTRRRPPSAPSLVNADGTVSIPLCAIDGSVRAYAIVDAADADWVNQWVWRLNDDGYAKRNQRIDGTCRNIPLHRALLGLVYGDGLDGDHIDKNRLNCTRANLRVLPHKGRPNNQNCEGRKNSTSRYRGVSWYRSYGLWVAQVRSNGKKIHVGYFSDEVEAAEAAREARRRLLPYAVD